MVTWYGALLMRKNGWTLNLNKKEMDTIFQEVQESVSKWEELAKNTGIPSVQRRLMEAAFHLKKMISTSSLFPDNPLRLAGW